MSLIEATLLEKKRIAKDTMEFTFSVSPKYRFTYEAGQYAWIILPKLRSPDPQGEYRAFSFSSTPQKNRFSIITRITNSGYKQTLARLIKGTKIKIRGPQGSAFTLENTQKKNLVMIGGGVGIAPFLSIIRSIKTLSQTPEKITLAYYDSSADRQVNIDDLKKIATTSKRPSIEIKTSLKRFTIKNVEPIDPETEYWICGPQKMVDDVHQKLTNRGIPETSIKFEQYYPTPKQPSALKDQGIQKRKTKKDKKTHTPQEQVLILYSCFAIGISAALIAYYSIIGKPFSEISILYATTLAGTVNLFNFFVFRKTNYSLFEALTFSLILVAWGMVSGILDGFMQYWLYFFPVIALFFQGLKRGAFWTALYILMLAGIYTASYLQMTPYYFDVRHIVLSLTSVLNIAMLAMVSGYIFDKSQRKIQKLSEQERVFRLAVESSMNHMVITDPNGMLVYANSTAEKTTGFRMSEMRNNTPRLWGGQMSASFYKKMWMDKKTFKKPFSGELTNIRKDGTLYTVLAHISPILNEKEEVIGYIGTEEDITEKHELEMKLEKKIQELERANRLMVAREIQIKELKERNNAT